jgi:chaperonin cofactor prefoldin
MIKSNKEKIKEELSGKEKILNLRIKTLEKQENTISERIEKLRNEIMGAIKPQ